MNNSEYNLPEGIDIFTFDFIRDISNWPATDNSLREVYILKNNEIVCTGRIGSLYHGIVRVYLETSEALEIFKDDEAVKIFGKHASFPFAQLSGFYEVGLTNESEDRGVGLSIVDKMNFDFGIASKMRYSHIPGFGNRTNRTA